MYIVKNALRSIRRSKGRNILIGIIALVIAVSACVALSIKESAVKAREDTLSLMNITAQITLDRQAMMNSAKGETDGEEPPEFDRDSMKQMLQSGSQMTLEEYQTYAQAESVKDSYYSLTVTLDASGDLEPIDTMGTFDSENGETQAEIMKIFRRLADEGKCVIIVTHSPDVASSADVKFELRRGEKNKN
ncbi:MAG: hypothetical protein U0L33_04500 [Acutalibacteraceae bacterium]|nr:hypothetical protein [Acutalibacteraceae bacterium]